MPSQKLEKFERLAQKRMNVALKKISLLGNLANTANYAYTERHVSQIIKALKDAVREVEARFQNKGKTDSNQFVFKI